jgi:hypothetical protein
MATLLGVNGGEERHKPTSLEKNVCTSSVMGYRNNNRGASGATAAIIIMVSRCGPTVIHRIPSRR